MLISLHFMSLLLMELNNGFLSWFRATIESSDNKGSECTLYTVLNANECQHCAAAYKII